MRSERAKPWRPKPTQAVVDMLAAVSSTTMYVVQQCGPTSFIVKEDSEGNQHHVTVGSLQQCTCHRRAQASAEICQHIVFVMVKVLKVQPDSPLVWQLSLVDRELEEILRNRNSAASSNEMNSSRRPKRDKKADGVSRKAIARDDICPICYDDIHGTDMGQLTWCQLGCGQNIHGKCMKVWMNHNSKTQGKELRCPMCRCEWGAFTWRPPPKRSMTGHSPNPGKHIGSKCHACGTDPICGSRYQCCTCWKLDLCSACFKKGGHPEHEFLHFEHAGARGTPASRSLFEVTCCKLGIPQQPSGSCVLDRSFNTSRGQVTPTTRKHAPTAAVGALCIGGQPRGSDIKPQASRLRTGRSHVASSGMQTLPRIQEAQGQQRRTLRLASATQPVTAEQPDGCGDLTLFGVWGGSRHVEQVGLAGRQHIKQHRKAWSRLDAARTWAERQKSSTDAISQRE